MGDIIPSKHSSASVPSLHHVPHSPSFTSLALSEGDIPIYAPTLVDESGVVDLPAQSDIIIAVIGSTGAGKSTFINKAVGMEETEVGHLLSSCTQKVQIVRCLDKQQNRQIVLVDTPGFNDTNMSDLDTLQLIANWLKLTYKKGIHLSGLLFFHRISDNRMSGSAVKYNKMFQNLCGNEALKNVVLVTTMWDEVEEEEGRDRETELSTKPEYWKTMLDLGCRTSRFYNNTESARDIISQFQDAQCTLLLQRELVDLRLELAETSAGRTLFYWLIEFIKNIKQLLAQLEAKLKQNRHSENRTVFEKSKATTEATLRDADAKRRQYSVSSRVFRPFISNSRPSTPVNARRPLLSATLSHPPTLDNNSNATSHSKTTPVAETACTDASFPLTSSPTIEYFSRPPSLADSPGQAYHDPGTCALLQGTITALKLVQQIVGLSPVPGLQSLVGLVLNITEIVNDMNAAENSLIELAQTASSFMVTLVDQDSISFSDPNAMKSIIERLTKEMERVLKFVKRISSQRIMKRLLLSTYHKEVINNCNRQIMLASTIYGIQIAVISQQALARIEAKLNLALNIPPQSNNQTNTVKRSTTC